MTGETVDENAEPISKKTYWGSARVFKAYNTDYLAQGIPKSQEVYFSAYDLTWKEKILCWIKLFKKNKNAQLSQKKQKNDKLSTIVDNSINPM